MKVLHIMSGYGGGISSFILNKAEYFQKNDISFDVMTFHYVPDHFHKTIKRTGGKIYYIPNPKRESFKKFYKQVNQIMERLPKDTFVHCHLIGYRALPFYLIARKNNLLNFAIHTHTTGLPEEINTFKSKSIRFINSTISKTKISCGKESSKYLFGQKYVENKEIMHIPNSINPDKFIKELPVNKSTLLGERNKEKFVIGHIGRFTAVKNHIFMLEIIEKLKKTTLDFIWVFIGDGDTYEEIKNISREKNLEEYTLFIGRRTDIPELLQTMDFFVLPSKYEGFPTVAVEAQATGIKTILSDTITLDVDLQLGLVEFLPINNPEIWSNFILNNQYKARTEATERLKTLVDKKLTNESSAKLYKDFLENKISHYEI